MGIKSVSQSDERVTQDGQERTPRTLSIFVASMMLPLAYQNAEEGKVQGMSEKIRGDFRSMMQVKMELKLDPHGSSPTSGSFRQNAPLVCQS